MSNPPVVTGSSRRARILLLAAIVLLTVTTTAGVLMNVWHSYLDLHVYRTGARVLLDGHPLYGPMPSVDGTHLPFTYPPLAAMLFTPFAIMPVTLADVLMFAATLAALAVSLWMILDRLTPRTDPPLRVAIVIALTSVFTFLEPVRENLGFGQVNMILMAMVVFDVLCRHPRWPRGLLIGIAVSIKLTPAGFLLYFVLRRDWRAVGWLLAGTVGSIGLAWLISPSDSVQYWFHTLRETGRIGAPYFAGNQSIKGAIFRFGLPDSVSTLLWLGLSAAAVAVAAVWMHRLLAEDRDAVGVGSVLALLVNAAVILLISPVSWSHHWVWAAPALMVAGYAVVTLRVGPPFAAAWTLALVVFAVGPHWLMPARHDAELTWTWWQHLVGNSYVWLTAAVLVAGAVRRRSSTDLRYSPSPSAGHPELR
ncbi:glycosyltransferase 87 family protein [Gordonia phthalatica]|uniref:Glycosyltransferase n=1 Tax=Gordonia phthalatica TaxID=1136941 RepID=A0A0N9N560_9ACTN|nr:glycosyltransferase 87 family protein [Gordonia phthalatica]ALG85617.1 glycosyltransferase [Gordonia phthalatica]